MPKDLVNAKKRSLRSNILYLLYNQSSLSIPIISKKLKVSIPTVTKVIEELMQEDWILDSGKAQSNGGRCANLYSLSPDGGYIIMVAADRYSFKTGIANLQSEIIGPILSVPKGMKDEQDLLVEIQNAITTLIRQFGSNCKKILGIGIAMPGLLDIKTGQNLSYTKLSPKPLKEYLNTMFPYPVFLEHDTSAIALAEQSFGLAKGKKNVLCVYLSDAIGVGLILNGKLYKGNSGFAGELGHIPVSDHGETCYCGKVGCLETVASGKSLIKKAQDAIRQGQKTILTDYCPTEQLSMENLLKGIEEKDALCIQLVKSFSDSISIGIAILMHVFNPELIILGGSLSRAKIHLLEPLLESLDKYVLPQIKNDCSIVTSELGENAMLKGCVALVINEIYHNNSNIRQS